MAKRGRKTVDRTGWIRGGGPLPAKPAGLSPEELRHYRWLVEAMDKLGLGGAVDLQIVTLTARQLARLAMLHRMAASLEDPMIPTPKGPAFHPVFAELASWEIKLKDNLCALYLTPRTRGQTRLPAETVAEISAAGATAQQAAENPILRLLGG
jgi:hypothetical protein